MPTQPARGWKWIFDCRDATGEGELDTLLQQGCCSAPILQSPAIFLQQAISDFVICGLGRHAIAVGAAHARTKRNASTCRNLPIAKCYPVPADLCKQAPGHLQVIIIWVSVAEKLDYAHLDFNQQSQLCWNQEFGTSLPMRSMSNNGWTCST